MKTCTGETVKLAAYMASGNDNHKTSEAEFRTVFQIWQNSDIETNKFRKKCDLIKLHSNLLIRLEESVSLLWSTI